MKEDNEANTVTFKDNGNGITIEITGAAYTNMRLIADALNRMPWADSDNTPATVADYWIGGLLRRVGDSPEDDNTTNVTELTNDLIDGIDTGADFGTEADDARRSELKSALDAIAWN